MDGPGTAVVLYVCTTQYGAACGVMDGLHDYAAARGWTVAGSCMDTTGMVPEEQRPGLQRAKAAIEAGRAQVLVTRYLMMAAADDERPRLEAWLAAHGATLHATWQPASQVTS